MRSRIIPFLTIFALLIIHAPCNGTVIKKESYQGDGKFYVRVRDYGVAKTYGYDLQFNPFITDRDTHKRYALINLPINYDFKTQYMIHFEISVGVPSKSKKMDILNERSKNIPSEHEISYSLTNNLTGQVLNHGKRKIKDIEPTHHREYKAHNALFIKNLFDQPMDDLTSLNDLTFEFTYKINGKPTNDKMFIFISLMAPTL
jgi:hypothetical protein